MYSHLNNKKNFRISKNHKPTNLFNYIGNKKNEINFIEGNGDNANDDDLDDQSDNKIIEEKWYIKIKYFDLL